MAGQLHIPLNFLSCVGAVSSGNSQHIDRNGFAPVEYICIRRPPNTAALRWRQLCCVFECIAKFRFVLAQTLHVAGREMYLHSSDLRLKHYPVFNYNVNA